MHEPGQADVTIWWYRAVSFLAQIIVYVNLGERVWEDNCDVLTDKWSTSMLNDEIFLGYELWQIKVGWFTSHSLNFDKLSLWKRISCGMTNHTSSYTLRKKGSLTVPQVEPLKVL